MMKFEEFKIRMLNEFIKDYPESYLDKENLKIIILNLEVEISLKVAFEEYSIAKDFKFIYELFKKSIEEELKKHKFKVDYSKVYALIKSKDFGKEESVEFLREHLFLNLDVLYAVDCGETFRFVLENDKYDLGKLKQNALSNIDSASVGLTRIDEDFEVYTIPFLTDYSSSYILLDKMKKQIERKVGLNYLLAIPSSTSIIVARNHPKYIHVLQALVDADPDPHTVSRLIYRFRNGRYEYVDKSNIFKIVK